MWKKSSNHRVVCHQHYAFDPCFFTYRVGVASIDCAFNQRHLPLFMVGFWGVFAQAIHKMATFPPSKKQLGLSYVFPIVVFSCMVSAYVRNVGPIFISEVFQTHLRKRWETPSLWAFAEQKRMSSHDSIVWPINVREFFPIMQSGLNINGVQNTCTHLPRNTPMSHHCALPTANSLNSHI